MASWTYAAYQRRLRHEISTATGERGIARLRATLTDVERFLVDTWGDADVDGWIGLLRGYEAAATAAGRRFG